MPEYKPPMPDPLFLNPLYGAGYDNSELLNDPSRSTESYSPPHLHTGMSTHYQQSQQTGSPGQPNYRPDSYSQHLSFK